MPVLEFTLAKSKMSNFNVISSCCFSTSKSISRLLLSIYPSIENTYTNLVRRLSLKFTTSSDVALVETNSDSRLGNHCMYDERGGVMGNLCSERLSTTSPSSPPHSEKSKIKIIRPNCCSNRRKSMKSNLTTFFKMQFKDSFYNHFFQNKNK